jgi:cell division protein FtsB
MSAVELLPPELQTLTALLAGAVVPLLIYLFSRRAQLRQLNTSSDATLVTSATALVASLQDENKTLTVRIERLERDRTNDRTDYAAQLARAHNENSRLAAQVAQLQTDLDIATRQIADLRALARKSAEGGAQ